MAAATGARLTAITATDGAAPASSSRPPSRWRTRTARPDPFTVLVDLRNVATSGYANGFTARPDSPVRSVAVESARDDEGHPVARVRVSLSEPISHRVRSQRNLIFVELVAATGDGRHAGGRRRTVTRRRRPLPRYTPSRDCAMAIPARALISRVRTGVDGGATSIILVGNGRLARRRTSSARPASVCISTFRASPPRCRR